MACQRKDSSDRALRKNRVDLICRNASRRGGADGWIKIRRNRDWRSHMMDILMLALALGWFALAIGYTYACERL
jgi:hypothetical protein